MKRVNYQLLLKNIKFLYIMIVVIFGGDIVEYLLSAIIGYVLGSINTANIIARSRGVNIKAVGSNNAGASNVFISVGKFYGVLVGALDILKSFCAAEIVFLIFSGNRNVAILAGAMAVVGHIFPFWMNFKGGKGLAPFMGMMLFYDWKMFLIFAVIIAAIVLIIDYIAVGALFVTAVMPVYSLFRHEYFIAAFFVFVAIIMWCKHKENIIRLKNGTEIGFRGKNKIKK